VVDNGLRKRKELQQHSDEPQEVGIQANFLSSGSLEHVDLRQVAAETVVAVLGIATFLQVSSYQSLELTKSEVVVLAERTHRNLRHHQTQLHQTLRSD